MASCRAEADLKGVGVQGDDSTMERQMFGVLNLTGEKQGFRKAARSTNVWRWLLSRTGGAHNSLCFGDLRVWPLRGLDSTGEVIGKLSSECSELIDWFRN